MTALDRPDLHAAIEQRFPDNTNERITPELLRDGLHEIVDNAFIKASDEGVVPNVPLYDAGTDYTKGYTVRYPTGTGTDAFYYSLRAGKLPAPSGSSVDVNWKMVPGPVASTALSQQLTLLQAQAIEGTAVVAGRSYLIDFGPNANGNAQVVTLLGTAANLFAIRGQLTVAGVRSNVRVNVASGVFGEEAFDLLKTANIWLEVQDFTKGIKLPAGAKVDEGGSAFFQRLDIGQRHYTFGLYHSLGKDSMIQWKPTEFINQDGDGDVGLARSSQGVLEVNTGRRGRMARLSVADVEAYDAPFNLSTINLLAQAILDMGAAKGAKILWVCGGLPSYSPQRGSLNHPYSSLQQAHNAALAGDLLIVQPGGTGTDALGRAYYSEDFLWTKNVRIVFQAGAIHGGLFQLARFNDADPATLFKRELVGGEFTNRTLAWRHSAGNVDIEVTGAKFTGNGNFEVAGSGSYHNSFLTSARLRNCLFDVDITDSDKGAVRLTGRDDMGPVGLVLENTRVISVRTPTITFQANSTSFVTLQGALTELVGTPPETLPTVPSGFSIAKTDWLHDQRPTTGGGGSSGASTFAQLVGNPRDNAALASELNAVLALSDGRRNLITTSSARYNDLVLESRVTLTNLKRGPNASAVNGQLLQNGTVAVSAPRQGSDADVLAALNADIAALADYTFYIIRFQTSVAVSTDVAHVLLTVVL
jgi:hypothetical protein